MHVFWAKPRPHDEAGYPGRVGDRTVARSASFEEGQDGRIVDQQNLERRAPHQRRGWEGRRVVPRLESFADVEGHRRCAVRADWPHPQDCRTALSEGPGVASPRMGRSGEGAWRPPAPVLSDPRRPPGGDVGHQPAHRATTLRGNTDERRGWASRRNSDAGHHGPHARVDCLWRTTPDGHPLRVFVPGRQKPSRRGDYRNHRGLRGPTSVGVHEKRARESPRTPTALSIAQPERGFRESIVVADLLLVDLPIELVVAADVEHSFARDADAVAALALLDGHVAS